ncbi:MAG: hypothetical protein K5866_09250 [Treponema sp.]|nr:hypothetical protein [Treponema sp.]
MSISKLKAKSLRFFSTFILLFSIILISSCSVEKSKRIKVAFCNLPQELEKSFTSELDQKYPNLKLEYSSIPPVTKSSAKSTARKYDLVFTWDGQSCQLLKNYTQLVEKDLISRLPNSSGAQVDKALPLLLDHYGLAFYLPVKNKYNPRYPNNFAELERYLRRINGHIDHPFFIAAGDDKEFISFLSCFVESFSGSEGYSTFIQALKDYKDFDTFIKTPLDYEISLGSILELLKEWSSKGFLNSNWLNLKKGDLQPLLEDSRAGIIFLSLSDFHKMSYESAKQIACDRFPVVNPKIPHALIAPKIVCLNTSNKSVVFELQDFLLNVQTQKRLSKASTYAPAESSCMAYDKQADDLRFLAAACKAGPVDSAATLVFENDSEQMAKICQEIRNYLKI